MADRDDKNSNRGLASVDREARERVARKGGEEPHNNDDKRYSSLSGGGSSSGSRSGRD